MSINAGFSKLIIPEMDIQSKATLHWFEPPETKEEEFLREQTLVKINSRLHQLRYMFRSILIEDMLRDRSA